MGINRSDFEDRFQGCGSFSSIDIFSTSRFWTRSQSAILDVEFRERNDETG